VDEKKHALRLTSIGVDLTGILVGLTNKSPAVEAKNTFSYFVMQVIWCLKLCNMTKSGGTTPPLQIPRGLVPPSPVIYAHAY